MNIFRIVEEQFAFNFTGRINILQKTNGRLLGYLRQKSGNIVDARFFSATDRAGLYNLIMYYLENQDLVKIVVEPEVVENIDNSLSLSFDDFFIIAQEVKTQVPKINKFRPPDDLKISYSRSLQISEQKLSSDEYYVLSLVQIKSVRYRPMKSRPFVGLISPWP
jgi:hypothetical protein